MADNSVKVGFWYDDNDQDRGLPRPRACRHLWRGRASFLLALAEVEKTATATSYKGSHTCRTCKTKQGSREFRHGKYVWPVSLSHYIAEHKIMPPTDFIKYIRKVSNMERGSSVFPEKSIPSADLLEAYRIRVQQDHYSPTAECDAPYPHVSLGDMRKELARRLGIYDVARKDRRSE